MSLLRKPQKTILQVCNSLKINRHFQGNFGKKDFSEGAHNIELLRFCLNSIFR